MTTPETAGGMAQGLRELADLIEEHPELAGKFGTVPPHLLVYALTAREFSRFSMILNMPAPSVDKYAQSVRSFGPFRVQLFTDPKTLFVETVIGQAPVSGWILRPGILDREETAA